MSNSSACPELHSLHDFLLGHIADPEAAGLEQHLLHCEHCSAAVATLKAEDTFTEALRNPTTVEMPVGEVVAELMKQLRELPVPSTAPSLPTIPFAGRDLIPSGAEAEDWTGYLAPPREPGEIGRLGPYRVLSVLGAGGMGMVFQAEDPQLKRRVALKVMRPALAAKPDNRRRFLREAQSVAALSHDYIIPIYQAGEDSGVPFLAMPLLQGESLEDRLRRDKVLPPDEVLRIGREVAEGLAAAHAQGVIHRDVKPSNIWLEAGRGRVKIVDFGLARIVTDEAHLTQTGVIVGTPSYLAPEQARGGALDARCDLFSLGCVLYRLCTGEVPFAGRDTLAALLALATEQPLPPCQCNAVVPPALSDLVMHLLAKDPAQRPASATVVAEGLAAIEREQAAPGNIPATLALRQRPWRRWLAPAAAAVLFLAAGGLFAQQVIIRLQGQDGTTEIKLPPGVKAEIIPPPRPKVEPVVVQPSSAPALVGGALSSLALVARPAALAGVHSWTIETRSHRGSIVAMAYDPDGTRLATGDVTGTIRLWDAAGGRLLRVLVGHDAGDPEQAGETFSVWGLAWSPDGKLLASSGADRTVRLWDTAAGRPLAVLREHEAPVGRLAWSPDGKLLASASLDRTVQVFGTLLSARPLRVLQHVQAVTGLSWSPGGLTLATGSIDGLVRLWKAATGRQLRALEGHSQVSAVAWSPDGKLLASTGADARLRLWDPLTGESRALPLKQIGDGLFIPVAWSPDGKRLACGGSTPALQLWDPATGRPLGLAADVGSVRSLAWSPDGKTLATGGDSCQVSLLDSDTGRLLQTLPGYEKNGIPIDLTAAVRSPDGKLLAVQDRRAVLRLHELASGRLIRSYPIPGLSAVAFSAEGKALACGINDGTIRLLETDTGKELHQLKGHTGRIHALAFSPDGNILASTSDDKTIRLWETKLGQLLRPLEGEWGTQPVVAWSPDSKTLACGEVGLSEVRLAAADSGRVLQRLPAAQALALGWSPDGKLLATASRRGLVQVWESGGGKCVATGKGHQGGALSITWLAEGKRLASVGADRTLRFWEAPSGRLERTETLAGALGTCAFDRQTLFCFGGSLLRGWDLETAQPRGTLVLLNKDSGEACLVLTADGHYRTGSTAVEGDLVYVVQTDKGQEPLSSAEFARRYGWKNDPGRAHLLGR